MDQFANNMKTLLEASIPYAWVLVAVSFAVIGIMFAVPSERSHDIAKKAIGWVIVGALCILGSIYLGNWVCGKIVFSAS